jgi:hypothetical protein
MSMNLTLQDDRSGSQFNLFQTPTVETHRILKFSTHEDKIKNYISWLADSFKNDKKRLDLWDKEMIDEHEHELRKFVHDNPNCKWGKI